VHGAGWQHDGSSPAGNKLSYGNCFVTVAVLVRLPFCSREIGLPVLARLHLPGKKDKGKDKGPGGRGKGTTACTGNKARAEGPSKVDAAAALVSLLALAFPGRMVHVVADAAYHGPALRTLPGNVTWTCRIPRNAAPYHLAPPRTGKRGRPRTKGSPLGTPGRHRRGRGRGNRHRHRLRPGRDQARRRGHLPVVRLLAHPHRPPHPVPRPRHGRRL
jgi:hypothetical protein